jgi:BirA family biotin operon repressor/biotin-[acetyl-CoA-carboxylase] ligase
VTFVAALAAADLVATYVPPPLVTIKWPNDVMLEADKARRHPGRVRRARDRRPVAGRRHRRQSGRGPDRDRTPRDGRRRHLKATSIAADPVEDAAEILAEAFRGLDGALGDAGLPADPRRLDLAHAGASTAPAVARLGHETLEGMAEGVEADGALRLRLPDGSLRLISAGDVFFGTPGGRADAAGHRTGQHQYAVRHAQRRRTGSPSGARRPRPTARPTNTPSG